MVTNPQASHRRGLRTGKIEVDTATNKVMWIDEYCPQQYLDIKKLAEAGRSFICRDSQLLDLMPIDVLKAMPHIVVMTFLFEASHLCWTQSDVLQALDFSINLGKIALPLRNSWTQMQQCIKEKAPIS